MYHSIYKNIEQHNSFHQINIFFDTEDWSYDFWKFSFAITGIHTFLK